MWAALASWVGFLPRSMADALPDPLVDAAAGILQHMNADHKDALVVLRVCSRTSRRKGWK